MEVLRLAASFHSMDSWSTLLGDELPLETESKPAVFNEVQRRITDDEFRTLFYDFATDLLGDDLRGDRTEHSHWDVVEARYMVGKGSALRGQASGNWLEDKIRDDVLETLGLVEDEHFVHVGGRAEVTVDDETYTFAKGPDYVIPDLDDARVLIEAKAYVSSTGSKQTDVLGDITKLEPIAEKGVPLFMVLDGPMWRRRVSDLQEVFAKRDQGVVDGVYGPNAPNATKRTLRAIVRSRPRSPAATAVAATQGWVASLSSGLSPSSPSSVIWLIPDVASSRWSNS
jgi:hypothetical protein